MISIVIPLYNKAQSIAGTLLGIQAQTVQDFEVVIVDGYSTDGSLETVRRMAEEDPRIRVLMQQNRHGVTPARNESIAAASSERIVFIDADDIWEPGYLEKMLRLMDDFPEAGIWGLAYGAQEGEQRTGAGNQALNGFRGILPRTWAYGCPYWTGATAISKAAFEAVGGFDNSIIFGEDIDLWYRLMLRFPAAFDGTGTPLAWYRLDAENRASVRTYKPEIDIPFHIGKYADARRADPAFRAFFDRQMLYRLWPYAGKKEFRAPLREALKQIDFSLQKPSLRWRFVFPRLYKLYLLCKSSS